MSIEDGRGQMTDLYNQPGSSFLNSILNEKNRHRREYVSEFVVIELLYRDIDEVQKRWVDMEKRRDHVQAFYLVPNWYFCNVLFGIQARSHQKNGWVGEERSMPKLHGL